MARTRRVVLLGRSGSGKSSLANTIFNDEHAFTVSHSPNSNTRDCESVTRTVHGRDLTLVDTPGFFDIDPESSTFSSEIMRCLKLCDPGPHAFLLVLKVEKYTAVEQALIKFILHHFSAEALRYTTVVFTHGNGVPKGMKIEQWAQQNPALRDLLQACGNSCHVVDNQNWRNQGVNYQNNQNQVRDLLNTIDQKVAANGGSHFPNPHISLLSWFEEAPIGYKIAVFLGVAAMGCLLVKLVPWAKVREWVKLVVKNGADWIWRSLPTTDDIKKAVVYLAQLQELFQKVNTILRAVMESSGRFCIIL